MVISNSFYVLNDYEVAIDTHPVGNSDCAFLFFIYYIDSGCKGCNCQLVCLDMLEFMQLRKAFITNDAFWYKSMQSQINNHYLIDQDGTSLFSLPNLKYHTFIFEELFVIEHVIFSPK